MDNHRTAERFLTLLTTRERAAEIVGDLLEQHAGSLFLPALRIAFALVWRSVLAYVAAVCCAWSIDLLFSQVLFWRFGYSGTPRQFSTEPMLLAQVLIVLAVLIFIRHGYRSVLFGVAAPCACIVALASCLTWLPHAGYVTSLAFALTLTPVLFFTHSRRAILSVTAAAIIVMLTMLAFDEAIRHLDSERWEYSHRLATLFLTWPLALFSGTIVLKRLMHRMAPPTTAITE